MATSERSSDRRAICTLIFWQRTSPAKFHAFLPPEGDFPDQQGNTGKTLDLGTLLGGVRGGKKTNRGAGFLAEIVPTQKRNREFFMGEKGN